jgi:NADPH:quinone reductase-like Zn-dependent oxidoreductase
MQVGAKGCVLYKNNHKWDEELIRLNKGKRFDALLDCVGVSNLERTINLLEIDGRWILYGLLSGVIA